MRSTIASYLQEGPDGKFYYRMVDNVLSREKNWVRWKVESCPAITKDPIATEDYLSARSDAKRAFANKRIRPTPMGALDLSFLSDTQNLNNLDKLRHPPKNPSIQTCLKDISGLDLDLEMAGKDEETALRAAKAVKTWNLLRIASKSRLGVFGDVDEKSLDKLGEDITEATKDAQEAVV